MLDRLSKPVVWLIIGVTVLVCSTLIALMVWVMVSYFDKETPMQMISYKADDAYIGEELKEHIIIDRVRQCSYKFSKMAVDVKGQIVFQTEGGRPVNGPLGRVSTSNTYNIDKKAAPGIAVMHWYSFWQCPGNPLHLIRPMFREYTDTFELKLRPGQKDLSDTEVAPEAPTK